MKEKYKTSPESSSTSRILVQCLQILAGFSAVAGIVAGFWGMARDWSGESGMFAGMLGIGLLCVGLVGGGVVWALAGIIQKQDQQLHIARQISRNLEDGNAGFADAGEAMQGSMQPTPPPLPADTEALRDHLNELRVQLEELNTNMLLSEPQRQAKRLLRQKRQAEEWVQDIEQALQRGDIATARRACESLQENIPDEPRLADLQQRVDQARREVEAKQVQREIDRTGDLMSVARFNEALQLAERLEETHPDLPEVDGLLKKVIRERETYEAEQRTRLYRQVRSCGEARQWKAALQAAHRLLEAYPRGPEAEKVQAMMPTIVDNARIEEVRELRDRILDLMERRRYAEAVELARQVMENFPETAAADELRQQMPRLRELAMRKPGQDQGETP